MKSFARFFLVALAFILANTGFGQLARANETSAYDVYTQSVENSINLADQEDAAISPAKQVVQPSQFQVNADNELVPVKKGSMMNDGSDLVERSQVCIRKTVTQCGPQCDCGCSKGRRAYSCYIY